MTAPLADRCAPQAEAAETTLLRRLFDVAVAAADPRALVAAYLSRHMPVPPGAVLVVGAGKAAASMAAGVEDVWGAAVHGLVITRYGHGVPTRHIGVREAGHPLPDAAGVAATGELIAAIEAAPPDTFVLVLISGGGSALLVAPVPGLSLAEKQAVNAALLASGAPIGEVNTVRRLLSRVKGGGLAAVVAPRPSLTLVLSDVPGDDPAVVASGPMTAVGGAAGVEIARRLGVVLPAAVEQARPPPASDMPSPVALIGSPLRALAAVADAAAREGWQPLVLSDAIEGEAREVAKVHAAIALSLRAGQGLATGAAPGTRFALISGGETGVTVRNPHGQGGRNGEFALALALALGGAPGIRALAADSDGIDGHGPAAGALVGPQTLARARALGFDAHAALEANDSHRFFAALGDAVVTGPTGTNVNDIRICLVAAGGEETS